MITTPSGLEYHDVAKGAVAGSLAAALAIAGLLYRAWTKAGRPRGIRNAAAEAETE